VPRSDEIRKRQHRVAPERPLPASAYTEESSAAVFSELTRMVEVAARHGHAVIADATFMDLAHRSMVEAAAARAGVPFLGVWLSAPLGTLEGRIAGRSGDASDATVAVLRAAVRGDPGPVGWHAVDATDGSLARKQVMTLANSLGTSHIVP